jgi:2-iminobutanoate/2-iminopropanoate deaminase
MLEHISTPNAPAAIGPYSQAVKAGGFLYLSGMMPINPADGTLAPSEIKAQTAQILKNIDALLTDAGYCEADVVKTTCFLSDIANFGAFNEVYAEYFTHKPASSCFAVKDLPKGALAEVEVVAYK